MKTKAGIWVCLLAVIGCAGCVNPKKFPMKHVSTGLFEGYVPKTKEDFEFLRTNGVRTIVSLRVLPWHIPPEKKKAVKYGFNFVNTPIEATPLEPSEETVKAALTAMSDPALQPVYVHCYLGRDRTTLVVALYRIYFEDWTPEAAWNEMLDSGFNNWWGLRGFATYFWSHTEKPQWVKDLLAQRGTNAPPVASPAFEAGITKSAK